MIKAEIKKHILKFKFEAGTSRGVLKEKATWFVVLYNQERPEIKGIGECGPLTGLSIDDLPDFEEILNVIVAEKKFLNLQNPLFQKLPSIKFGFETALFDLHNNGVKEIFRNEFYKGIDSIPINGLIWMGSTDSMIQQIREKLEAGFACLKLKVGALDFQTEIEILNKIRTEFSSEIVLRLDANGAFSTNDALLKLQKLERFNIHSIEQPIKQGQSEFMAYLCEKTPVPIALDEDLIGIYGSEKQKLLEKIKPQYIILKPTLLGGFEECDEWISLAEKFRIGWWITSALESNIGLNAICQYAYNKIVSLKQKPLQGLGTGTLYYNNVPSPLEIYKGEIWYKQHQKWGDLNSLVTFSI